MKAVIYARISRDEQSNYSLEEQVKECRKYIENEGHEWVDTYIDDGYSAKDTNRPALQAMLADIPTKKFGLVVIWKLDRLTRDTLDGLTMVKSMFKPNGIAFASKTEDIDTSTPDGYMMFTIRLSMAQAEREKIRERVILGQTARARSGKRNSSSSPYGYRVVKDLALEIDEDEAYVVKQIFEWYLEGMGKNKIATILNERGVPCPKGGKVWAERSIDQIIMNPTYYGAVHWKRKGMPDSERIIVENAHEPIISKEIWDKTQDYINRRRESWMNQSSYDFPFSTIVKCGICSRSYHGKNVSRGAELNAKFKRSRIYRCSGRYRQEKCGSPDIAESNLVKLLFNTIQFNFDEIDENKQVDKETPDAAKEKKRLLKELDKSKERLMKLAKAMSSGHLDFEIYTQLREEEKKKAAMWEEQLNALPSDQSTDTRRLGEIIEELKNLKRDWDSWSHAEQKIRIQKIFKRISIIKVNGQWQVEEIEIHA